MTLRTGAFAAFTASVVLFGAATLVGTATAGTTGTLLLPNLRTLPFQELSIQKSPGVKRLRFSNTIGNDGLGVLELLPKAEDCNENGDLNDDRTAYQHLYEDTNGNGVFDRGVDLLADEFKVGCMFFHPAHNHWHFQDFARYELFAGDSTGTKVGAAEKVSFCVGDFMSAFPDIPGYHFPGYYGQCSQDATTGLSVGWADIYGAGLQGQALDIRGLPNGRYCLVSTADPHDRITESDDSDNVLTDRIRIQGPQVIDRQTSC